MNIGYIGYKLGMSSLQQKDSLRRMPVTLVHVPANVVTAVKSETQDGYSALQVASCDIVADDFPLVKSASMDGADEDSAEPQDAEVTEAGGVESSEADSVVVDTQVTGGFVSARRRWRKKNLLKHFAASQATKVIDVCEFRVNPKVVDVAKVGCCLDLGSLKAGTLLDVRGVSKGRGFSGGIRRWGFGRQPESHGTSVSHRSHGSTGQCQLPGRVMKGKKMAGQYGVDNVCVKNLRVVSVDIKNRIVAVRGAVPGARGGRLILKPVA